MTLTCNKINKKEEGLMMFGIGHHEGDKLRIVEIILVGKE